MLRGEATQAVGGTAHAQGSATIGTAGARQLAGMSSRYQEYIVESPASAFASHLWLPLVDGHLHLAVARAVRRDLRCGLGPLVSFGCLVAASQFAPLVTVLV